MDEYKKVIQMGVLIMLLLAVSLSLYYFLGYKQRRVSPAEEASSAVSIPAPTEEAAPGRGGEAMSLPSVTLNDSDGLMRQIVPELSSHPRLADWLKTKDLIRKFVAAVDNIAEGQSPRSHVDFFAPARAFKIRNADGRTYIDPSSFDRYNPASDVFISLDARACARFYRAIKPLVQEAYRDLGYPNEDFDNTLWRAIVELLSVPVVEGPIAVESKVSSFVMIDAALEGLSPAQKHLLRMGSENVQVIQAKLRDLAPALGFPENLLPKPRTYSARNS